MSFFRRLLAWFFRPSLARLEQKAAALGIVNLQQVRNADSMSWMCSIRPTLKSGYQGYAWTATAETIPEAMADAIGQAKEWPIGGRPLMPHAPKLGGREFDEE